MSDLPTVSIVTTIHDWEQFYCLFKHHWDTLDYPRDKLEWIIVDDSINDHSDLIPVDENIFYFHISSEEYLSKIEFPKDDTKEVWNYHNKMHRLPIGFKRDYAVGMTNHEYIFHLDVGTIYNPKSLQRKIKYLQKNKLECVYCKSMLCYDIYNRKLYKTENEISGYCETMCYSKDFWKRGGFQWSDTSDIGTKFYYNKGLDRSMDNYFDTITLLSIHNINKFRPKEINLENIEITIPDIVSSIKIDKHPLDYDLCDLFGKQESIQVLNIHSQILEGFQKDSWNVYSIEVSKNMKEKKIISQLEKDNKQTFNVCFINLKHPIWHIFKSNQVSIDVIILENEKNYSQMDSILKQNNYVQYNNLYISKHFLSHK